MVTWEYVQYFRSGVNEGKGRVPEYMEQKAYYTIYVTLFVLPPTLKKQCFSMHCPSVASFMRSTIDI